MWYLSHLLSIQLWGLLKLPPFSKHLHSLLAHNSTHTRSCYLGLFPSCHICTGKICQYGAWSSIWSLVSFICQYCIKNRLPFTYFNKTIHSSCELLQLTFLLFSVVVFQPGFVRWRFIGMSTCIRVFWVLINNIAVVIYTRVFNNNISQNKIYIRVVRQITFSLSDVDSLLDMYVYLQSNKITRNRSACDHKQQY